MKERAFSNNLKQATDPQPQKKHGSGHRPSSARDQVENATAPLRLCARFSGSEWGGIPPYRTASREPAPEPLRNRAQPSTSSGRAGRTLSTRSFEIWTVPVEAPRGFLMFLIWQQETAATPPPRALL